MNILAVSDETIERLYNTNVRETFPDVRILLGCGDLPYSYLEFLVTIFNVPLFYVPGNHDPKYGSSENSHVEGGTNLDGKVVRKNGLLLAGLGGSICYRPGAPNQYSQSEMYLRAFRLLPKIFIHTLQRRLDILVTHSPPEGIHDDVDRAHRGLQALNFIIKVAKPRYLLHGHTIFYKQNIRSHITEYRRTKVVNIYPYRLLDVPVEYPVTIRRSSHPI